MTKKQRNFRKSESGFGMLGMLLAAAAGLVVVAGLAESMVLMSRSQKSSELARDSQLIGDQVEAGLTDEASCTAAIGASPPTLSGLISGIPNQALSLPMGGTTVNLSVGQPLNQSLSVSTLSLKLADTVPAVTFTSGGVTLTKHRSELTLQTKKNTPGLFSPVSSPRVIPLDVVVDAGGNVKGCVAENDDTKACEAMGGVWNPVGATGTKCVTFKYCEWGGAFAQTGDVNTGDFQNQISGGYTCPAGYSKQQTGAIAAAARSGKYQVANNMTPIYTCLKCGPAVANSPPAVVPPPLDFSEGLSDLDSYEGKNTNGAAAVLAACRANGQCQ